VKRGMSPLIKRFLLSPFISSRSGGKRDISLFSPQLGSPLFHAATTARLALEREREREREKERLCADSVVLHRDSARFCRRP
jgi:hypothetical protein